MLGNECPECGVRLVNNRCPECGWIMVVAPLPSDPGCSACHALRAGGKHPPEWVSWQHCERCGDHSLNTAEFHPAIGDTAAPEDQGKRLCPSCWIPALRRRAALDPISAEDRARCLRTISAADAKFPSKRTRPAREAPIDDSDEHREMLEQRRVEQLDAYARHLAEQREAPHEVPTP